MSHQNVSSICLQNVSSKCLIKMFHQDFYSKCLIKMSHQHVSSKCLIKMSGKLVVFGSGGGSQWDWFMVEKSGRTKWLISHCTSQSTIDIKVNLFLHLLFLCPKKICSTHLTFSVLLVLPCLSVFSAVQPVVLGWWCCRLLWLQLLKTFTQKSEIYLLM